MLIKFLLLLLLSLKTHQVPEDLKQALISPLYKKRDRDCPSNYRPISLTCICSKLMPVWRGVNRIAFIPSFNNYFVVSTSQNKSVTQLDAFLLILCFYRFFGSICGGFWGFSFAKSTTIPSFALIARESTKVGTEREGCGNRIIFCPALIGLGDLVT